MVKKRKIVDCNRGTHERDRGIRRFFAAQHPAIEVYCDRRLFLTEKDWKIQLVQLDLVWFDYL